MSHILRDLHDLYFYERTLFCRIIFCLRQSLAKSLIVMAFWLWLEETTLQTLTSILSNLPDADVIDAINEASACLNLLDDTKPPPSEEFETPTTNSLLGQPLPVDVMLTSRSHTIFGIQCYLIDVCANIFTDILYKVIPIQGSTVLGSISYGERMLIPGFPNHVFGDIYVRRINPTEPFTMEDIWGVQVGSDDFDDDEGYMEEQFGGFEIATWVASRLYNPRG